MKRCAAAAGVKESKEEPPSHWQTIWQMAAERRKSIAGVCCLLGFLVLRLQYALAVFHGIKLLGMNGVN